jgi:hypothetical protein
MRALGHVTSLRLRRPWRAAAARGRRTTPSRTATPRSPTPPTSPSPPRQRAGGRRPSEGTPILTRLAVSRNPSPLAAATAAPGVCLLRFAWESAAGSLVGAVVGYGKATPPANLCCVLAPFPVRVKRRVRVQGSAVGRATIFSGSNTRDGVLESEDWVTGSSNSKTHILTLVLE